MTKHWPISRRTFLRGTGIALGLPLLETMGVSPLRADEPAKPPKRAAFFYVPNGVIHDSWKPTTEGAGYALPYSLEPLRDLKDDVLVLTGLSQNPYGEKKGVGHAQPTTALLTGKVADKDTLKAGKSVDQIIVDSIGGGSRIPSLQLGVEGTSFNGTCDAPFSCAYSTCISWRNETSPMPNDNIPRSVFKRLFGTDQPGSAPAAGASEAEAMRKSVLDFVLEDAYRLHKRLSRTDQQKLDEYLYSVRQLERRVQSFTPALPGGVPDIRLPEHRPADLAEHIRLMGDLLVLAFQTDATRVATFMFDNAAGNHTFPVLGVREGHHELSHHGHNEEKIAMLRKIDRYHVSLFAYFVGRMKSIPEGDGTLLDHSIVYYGSGLGNGNGHTPFDLPVLIAGRGAGTLQPGRHVKYALDTPLNNLWVSLMNSMDVPTERFGDSTGQLAHLSA